MNIYKLIENSNSLEELRDKRILPDPYDDSGFYYFYYAKADYRTVLPEIIGYTDSGLRVYYNRYYDCGKSFISDYLAKVKSVHCRCAVIYLSKEAIKDPVFYKLLKIISVTGCNYLSVNLPIDGEILSGEQIAEKYIADLEQASLVKDLFKNEITYIPATFSLAQKTEELNRAYRSAPMYYSLHDDFAVADYVYDLQEDNIVIPRSVLIGGKEYPVKAVRRGAFANCENLKKISFPETIEYIGFLGDGSAEEISDRNKSRDCDNRDRFFETQSLINQVNGTFYRCKNLEEIIFPPKVKILYKYEFCGCTSLKRIIFNECLQFYALDNYATIQDFLDLNESFLPDEIESDEDTNCDTIILEELRVPHSVCKTDDDRFKMCISDANNSWIDVELPAKKVSGYSYAKRQSNCFLDTQTFNIPNPESLVRIEYDSEWNMSSTINEEYRGCGDLVEAILPDRVETLDGTFIDCISLKKVKLPQNIRHLSQTFENCENLNRIDLPEGLEHISSGCFENTGLEEIRLPQKVMIVDTDAFSGCENLHTVISDSIYNKWLFKHKKNRLAQLVSYKHKWLFYVKLFFYYILFPFLHPKTFISTLVHHKELKEERLRFFEVCRPKNIYLKNGTGGFGIKGYKKIGSDKIGYIKYVKKR